MKIKLRDWAKENGYTYQGAYNAFIRGEISNAIQLKTGRILVDMSPISEKTQSIQTIVYARVSSSEQKNNLDSQASRMQQFCSANGWSIDGVIRDIGSGLNDDRQGLSKLMNGLDKPIRLVVEHKDRLTRFGFNYIKALIESHGGNIVVVNQVEDQEEDIMQDFVSIITSYCARIYGHRRSKRKTERLIAELQGDDIEN